MAFDFKKLKNEISSLSETDFNKFAQWFDRLHEQRVYQKQISTKNGIPYQDVINAFKKNLTMKDGQPFIWKASIAATTMKEFYLKKRVKGCDPDGGEDVLMTEWGPSSKKEFSLSHVREIAPPRGPDADSEVWQLRLEMFFPMTPELQRLKSGTKTFKSFKEVEALAFSRFAMMSPLGEATAELAPSRTILTYGNVE